jgi:hypothetical protein
MNMVRGLLGWSNKRTGLEFYRYDSKIIPRHASEFGDLLVYEHGFDEGREGCPVIVIILPRAATENDIDSIEQTIKEQFNEID